LRWPRGSRAGGWTRHWKSSGLGGYFAATATADEHPSKPHPGMLAFLLDRLGVDHRDAVMVGDSAYDLQMANSLRVSGVGVTHGAHDSRASALLRSRRADRRAFGIAAPSRAGSGLDPEFQRRFVVTVGARPHDPGFRRPRRHARHSSNQIGIDAWPTQTWKTSRTGNARRWRGSCSHRSRSSAGRGRWGVFFKLVVFIYLFALLFLVRGGDLGTVRPIRP
jgi:hypothetical protein